MSYYVFRILAVFAGVWLVFPALARADFVNPDFETGDMTGWTITVGPMAEYTNHAVIMFDMNASEPGGLSLAPQFSVGQANNGDTEYRHIDVTQELNLVEGQRYEFQFDWASHNYFFLDNFDGGVFDLIVDGMSLASHDTGSIFLESTEYGTLSGSFTATHSGAHTVGARIARRFRSTNNGTFILGQYLDNFSVTEVSIPEPSSALLIAVFGVFTASIYRKVRR